METDTAEFENTQIGPWVVRAFEADDLEPAVRLWEAEGSIRQAPSLSLGDLVNALSSGVPAVVAELDGELLGAAFARISGQRGWVQRLVIAEAWRGRGLGSQLLSRLEQCIADAGVDRLVAVLPASPQTTTRMFEANGWTVSRDVAFAEKSLEGRTSEQRLVDSLGGTYPEPRDWSRSTADPEVVSAIQRRVIDPLMHPATALSLGVRPPTALLLFGPPGTGKTTLAHALAGALSWPILEWRRPARSDAVSHSVGRFFDSTRHLTAAVLFLDEMEELAASRAGLPATAAPDVTNELLKGLTSMRSRQTQILVGSTNYVDRLDPAVLRPGRFDLVLPVGPPSPSARRSLITSRLRGTHNTVEGVDIFVQQTEGFTAADIAHWLDSAIQTAFDEALRGNEPILRSTHLQSALAACRPTLTADQLEAFAHEVIHFRRV